MIPTQLDRLLKFINKKLTKLKKNFLSFLFFLFFGFFLGNLFGTLVDSIRKLNVADSFLILVLIFIIEYINFIVYNKNNKKSNFQFKITLYNFLNVFKIGILLGFFIDSFKVGS